MSERKKKRPTSGKKVSKTTRSTTNKRKTSSSTKHRTTPTEELVEETELELDEETTSGFSKQPIGEDDTPSEELEDDDIDLFDDDEDDTDEVEDVQDGLFKLYRGEEDDDDDVDMTTLDQAPRRRTGLWLFVSVILLLAAVASTLGYLVFAPNHSGVDQGKVKLSVESVDQVASGEQLTFTIKYENLLASDIDVGTIEVLYPQGFYLRSADPQPVDQDGNTWHVNNVGSGTSGTIEVTGQLVGQTSDKKTFTVLFNYRPRNFSSDFQESESISVTVGESILDLNVNAPERARTGETFQYVYSFTNEASLPLTKVKAFVQYPQAFTPISATPSATQSNHTWIFDEIKPGETQEIIIKGSLDAESGSNHEFTTQIGLQEPDGFFNVQTENVSVVNVVNPELTLVLSAPEFAQAGQELEYSIDVENSSSTIIENIDLGLTFTGNALETSQIDLSTISELVPGEQKTLTQQVNVLPQLPADATEIVATLGVNSAQVDGAEVEFEQITETKTTLQSNVSFIPEARYYDDDLTQLGSGPLPPKVGSTTEYVIRWNIAASGGDVEDISVQTTLPDGVEFVSGDSNVTERNGTVTAQLLSVRGGETEVIEFTVAATPERDDIGKLLVLTNDAVLSANDASSGSSLQVQGVQLTSKLSSDPGTDASDGTVVKKGQ